MNCVEAKGKNVEEATNNALVELKTTRDKVDVEVLEEGSKGFLGIIGSKVAVVRVKLKKDYKKEARTFLRNILNHMGIKCEIRIDEKDSTLNINLVGPDMGIVIGHRGDTLDALQYLVTLAINKGNKNEYKRVIIDTENYRFKREKTLIRLANKIAYNVKKSGKCKKLEPMNPYERRIIHAELQNNPYVYTFSEGEEPYRRVVIDLKKA